MGRGAITQYIDVAQMVLYVFWVFFAGLVFYLLYESKREGFPLESDRRDGSVKREPGILPMPRVKMYRTRYHGDFPSPHERHDSLGSTRDGVSLCDTGAVLDTAAPRHAARRAAAAYFAVAEIGRAHV